MGCQQRHSLQDPRTGPFVPESRHLRRRSLQLDDKRCNRNAIFCQCPTSASVFFSFLVAGDGTTKGRYGALLRPDDGSNGPVVVGQSTGQSLSGVDDTTTAFTFRNNQATTGGLNGANANGTAILGTNLVVVEYNYDTNQARGWLNPTELGGTAPATTWSGIGFTDPNELDPAKIVNQLFFGQTDTAGTSTIFDEFRIGTTYAAVTPVPEPVSLALLAMGGLLLLPRKRA